MLNQREATGHYSICHLGCVRVDCDMQMASDHLLAIMMSMQVLRIP